MTDIESLRQRDNEFGIEEKLLCCVWVHDRYLYGKTFDDIQRDFEARFHKKAPKHDLLIMWERNAFNSGSVNFDDNCHMISNGATSSDNSLASQIELPKVHSAISRNTHKSSNSIYNLTSQNGQHKSSLKVSSRQATTKRPKQMLVHSANSNQNQKSFNQALYKTELCRQYFDTGYCDYEGKCLFAHGKHELKQISNYRTKVCLSWVNGHCQFGSNCMFIHPPSERSRKCSSTTSNKDGHYRLPSKIARTGH